MRKITTLLVIGALLLGMVSCQVNVKQNQNGTDSKKDSQTTNAEVTSESDTSADSSTEPEITEPNAPTVDSDNTDTTEPQTDYSKYLDEHGYFKGVEASEAVELPAYKGISINSDVYIAAEEDVQAEIDAIIDAYLMYNPYGEISCDPIYDRAVVDGDTVNIDYVGSVDGVEFSGGSTGGNGTYVTIGVTSYIDDFLYQLIGHKPGETINVEVTFPDEYPNNPDLEGKDAVFVTTINYIGDVKLTDDMAGMYGFESSDAMIADIEVWLVEMQKTAFVNDLLDSAVCSDVPQSVKDHINNIEIPELENQASMYGMTVEEYLLSGGFESKEVFTEKMASRWLASQAIAEIEGIDVTDEIIAENFGEETVEIYGKPYVKQYILVNVLIPEFIYENAVIVE